MYMPSGIGPLASSHANRWAAVFLLAPTRKEPYPLIVFVPVHSQQSPDLSTRLQKRLSSRGIGFLSATTRSCSGRTHRSCPQITETTFPFGISPMFIMYITRLGVVLRPS